MRLSFEAIYKLYPNLAADIDRDIERNYACKHCHKDNYTMFAPLTWICPNCGDKLEMQLQEYYDWTQNFDIKNRIDDLENRIFPSYEVVDNIIKDNETNSVDNFYIDRKKYKIVNEELLNVVLKLLYKKGYDISKIKII